MKCCAACGNICPAASSIWPIPSHLDRDTHSQDRRTLTLDHTQIQVFGELQSKLQDILRAVKAIVAAHKKTCSMAHTADGMDAED